MTEDEYIQALVELHQPLKRQGPGDDDFALAIMGLIANAVPEQARIADLGCGSGLASFLLAKAFVDSQIYAVDSAEPFITSMRETIKDTGLSEQVHAYVDDFANLEHACFKPSSFDLIWSEGAAYILGFENALSTWKPLLKLGGLMVVSEMSWQSSSPAKAAKSFWQEAYPAMATEHDNIETAKGLGFDLVAAKRLPSQAWWDNYYLPLITRMQQVRLNLSTNANMAMYDVLDETDREIQLFDQYSDDYGYTFYILKKVSN